MTLQGKMAPAPHTAVADLLGTPLAALSKRLSPEPGFSHVAPPLIRSPLPL